ncbi:unnamed protein product [Natator depressus]
MLGCPVLGGHGPWGAPGTGHLQICKRTDLLVVEINTVSCCSHGSAMDPGHWPARGSSTPWIYRSISGEYACLEKRLAAELWPARRPGPRAHQDPTWSKTIPLQHLPSSGDPLLGKGAPGDWDAPNERKLRGGSEGRRGLGWAAPPERRGQGAAASVLGRRRLAGSAGGAPPAGPPSYETHMLRRLRVGQGSRKPNEPRPPPYVSPPAYDAPHRTLPTKRPRAAPKPPAAKRGRAAPHGKGPAGGSPEPTPCSGRPRQRLARLPQEVLGGWSYHAGSGSLGRRAGSGLFCPGLEGTVRPTARGGSADSLFRPLSSTDGGSHTLPRASGEAGRAHGSGGWDAAGPSSAPGWQRLPSGWGFGYAPSSTGSARSGQREGWEQRVRPERRAPPSPRPAGKAPGQSPAAEGRSCHGGVFVIDATCVVIRAEYIPPPRRKQVQLLGSPPPRDPASPCQRLLLASRPHLGASEWAAGPPPPSPSPGDGSLGERAARILGLPMAELGLVEQQGACAQQETPGCWGQQAGAALPGSPEPLVGVPRVHGLPSPAASPEAPPGVPCSRETPGDGTHPPAEPGPGWGREAPGDGASRGEPQALRPRARPGAKPPALCTRDLREAMSRIRQHTAPDSDTDEEPEGPAPRSPVAGGGRPRHGALAYSSSSLESSGSDATVLPAGRGGLLGARAGPSPEAGRPGGLELSGAGAAGPRRG